MLSDDSPRGALPISMVEMLRGINKHKQGGKTSENKQE